MAPFARSDVTGGVPTLPLIGVAVLTGFAVLAMTGGLTPWLPAAAPVHALIGATVVVVVCATGDVGVLAVLAVSSTSEFGVLASLIRLGCCVHLLRGCYSAWRALRSAEPGIRIAAAASVAQPSATGTIAVWSIVKQSQSSASGSVYRMSHHRSTSGVV